MDLTLKKVVNYEKYPGFKGLEKYVKKKEYFIIGGIVKGEWGRFGASPGIAGWRQRGYGRKQQGGFLPLLLSMFGAK